MDFRTKLSDTEQLIVPKLPVIISDKTKAQATEIFTGKDLNADYKILQKAIRAEGETIPPLFNAYIGLSDTMKMFGTTIDADFGSVYETGIMVKMDDLLEVNRRWQQNFLHSPQCPYLRELIHPYSFQKVCVLPGFSNLSNR